MSTSGKQAAWLANSKDTKVTNDDCINERRAVRNRKKSLKVIAFPPLFTSRWSQTGCYLPKVNLVAKWQHRREMKKVQRFKAREARKNCKLLDIYRLWCVSSRCWSSSGAWLSVQHWCWSMRSGTKLLFCLALGCVIIIQSRRRWNNNNNTAFLFFVDAFQKS